MDHTGLDHRAGPGRFDRFGESGEPVAADDQDVLDASASVWADPRCSTITRWPCLVSTICTAVAPDRVFTFRRYGLTTLILTAR